MTEPVHIYASGAYAAPATPEPTPLKPLLKAACGQSKRRIDRTTQLSLLGACRCTDGLTPPRDSGVYLSSVYGSLNNSREILYDMYHHGEAPSPFKFINTVGSTTCFHLSQHFGFQGNSISLAQADFPVQSCLALADSDLHSRRIDAALVGVVSEIGYPLHIHRRRLGLDGNRTLIEGSYWLLIAQQLNGHTPLAAIPENRHFNAGDSLLGWLAAHYADKPLQTAFGPGVPEAMQQRALNTLTQSRARPAFEDDAFYEFPASVVIHDFLAEASAEHNALLYIDAGSNDRWHATLIEKP